MLVTDLFSGCGGFSKGFFDLGFKLNQAIEIDESASDTYERNLKLNPIRKDITKLKKSDFKKTDILIGGFPCQPFSLSGNQDGFEGNSGEGFLNCLKAIEYTKPKIFIFENVTGFKNLHGGIFLKIAERELIKLGYEVDNVTLNAQDFGVPQNRKRIFIIGNNINSGIPIFSKTSKSLISVKKAIDDLVGKEGLLPNHEPMKHTQSIIERFSHTLQGESTREAMDRIPNLGNAKISKQCYRRLVENKPAPTLVANFVTTTIHYSQNRNITAREGARIQSFDDKFIFEGLKIRMSWQKGLSQFEQIGNAVPPKMALEIAKKVKKMIDGKVKKTNKIYQMSFFDNLDEEYKNVISKIANKRKTSGKRGRKSKYAKLYLKFEKAKKGTLIKIPPDLNENIFFLETAMRRRNINFKLMKDGKEVKAKIL